MLTDWGFWLLLSCNFVIPITIIARRIISRHGVEFDHVFMFSCGFIFYWILPIALGKLNYASGPNHPNMAIWYDIFNNLTYQKLIIYMACTLAYYVSFVIGDLLSSKVVKCPLSKSYAFDKRLLNIPLLFGVIIAIYHAYPLADAFFTGYRISPMFVQTGPLTAVTVYLLCIALLFVPDIQKTNSGNSVKVLRALFNKASIIFIIMVMLLVSLGGRSVFVASILIILAFYTCYFKRLKVWNVIMIFCAIIIVSHIIVMFRMSQPLFVADTYGIRVILPFLLSDNLFISFSLIDVLNKYTFPALQFPAPLLSHLVGLMPSFIFPGKSALFIGYATLGYKILVPQGACNSFVSLMINFGIVGTGIFLFCVSFFLGWLKRKLIQPYQTMYVLTCGWIAIAFFRTFESATMKLIFEFSILIPFLITIILTIVSNIHPRENA